jgi:hypothetical protein
VVLVLYCIVILTGVRVVSTLILQTEVSAESGLCEILAPVVVRHRKRLKLVFVVWYEHGETSSHVVFGTQHVDEVSTEAVSGVNTRYIEVQWPINREHLCTSFMASVTRKPARALRNVLANVLKAIVEITFVQLIVSLIYTNIVKKSVMPKTLAEVVKLLKRVDNRNKSSYMIVRAMGIFTILADCQELRKLCTAEVTSKVLTQRFKKGRDMLVIEAGQIAEILIL